MQTDTIKLLRECNAGIKMGESAIKKVLPHTKNENLKNALIEYFFLLLDNRASYPYHINFSFP